MPRFVAKSPVRRGVECSFRARAAVVVLSSGGLLGSWAKRSGRGEVDFLIVRMGMYDGGSCCVVVDMRGRSERVDDGRRNEGGSGPQLKGGLSGGIVLMAYD